MDKKYERLRESMVKLQIESRGVKDPRVLAAMRQVERHQFVDNHPAESAYADFPLSIACGQTISQPYIVALMTELCSLRGKERVLEIGTGSGYQTAVLSLLAGEVFSLEVVPELAELAKARLHGLGYQHIHIQAADGYRGWPEEAPFDVIMLTACPPAVPSVLTTQLREGGVLVAPVGLQHQTLLRFTKHLGVLAPQTITSVRFVPMVHAD